VYDVGKKTYFTNVESRFCPHCEMWARELGNMLYLEELRFILKDKLSIFIKIWEPIRKFLQMD